MRVIHANWTAPFFARRNRDGSLRAKVGSYELPAHELITQVTSIAAARRFYGKVKLYTDAVGARYYERLGMLDLYDDVDVDTLQRVSVRDYNPRIHFTAGKMVVMGAEPTPFVMLDTDFFLERKPPARVHTGRVFGFAHWERNTPYFYGRKRTLPGLGALAREPWRWRRLVTNTAFAYFGDRAHRDAFVEKALRFLYRNDGRAPGLCEPGRALFAEQLISAHEADRLGVPLVPLVDAVFEQRTARFVTRGRPERRLPKTILADRGHFHHTWFYKARIKEDGQLEEYTRSLMLNLTLEWPSYAERVRSWKPLAPYVAATRQLLASA